MTNSFSENGGPHVNGPSDDAAEPFRETIEALSNACADLAMPAGGQIAFAPIRPDWERHTSDILPSCLGHAAPKRKQEFVAGRLAALAALRAAGLADPAVPAIGADRLPVWPEGWRGSISHGTEIAVAVVVPDKGGRQILGLDLEPVMPRDLAQQLAASLMPEARAGGQGMPAEIEITRVFSAKETLFKALYPQVRTIKEFSAARAIWNGDALSLALTEPWAEALPEGLVFAIEQRVAAGVVVSLLSGIAPDAPST